MSVEDTKTKSPSQILFKPKSIVMARQRTMPVQFDSSVIRVLPKHLRKRIKSADTGKKRKTTNK